MARFLLLLTASVALAGAAHSAPPPSVPSIDAPELAALGPYGVGYQTLTFTQAGQPDALTPDPKSGALPRRDRVLSVDVWYPANPAPGAPAVSYEGALTGEDGKDVALTLPGLAVAAAPPRSGSFPMVILAHGYGGFPAAMSWLAENLASKGYVVVAPRFGDPPITDQTKFAGPLTRRPLDIAFVAGAAARMARAGQGALASADPGRTVLIGYSMGGYGVLTDAGAVLNTQLAAATHGALTPYVEGGADIAALKIPNLKAVIAISPASRFGPAPAWSPGGLAAITAPTLFIVGDHDTTVGYDPGVKTVFDKEVNADRYMLTFENAGHDIGMDPAPPRMRHALWDQDWFEDAVWRKDRIIDISLHVITAFLDVTVQGDRSKRVFLDVPTVRGADGVWPEAAGGGYAAISAGQPGVTVWRGFQRGRTVGLELRHLAPAKP